jgi:hypothetical protein
MILGSDCSKEFIDVEYVFCGKAIDSITDLPIDSAWISIDDTIPPYLFYSDSGGIYCATKGFGIQSVKAYCGKNGYRTKDTSLYLDKNLENIDFRLVPND